MSDITLDAARLVAERDGRVRKAERERASNLILQLKDHLAHDRDDPIAAAIAAALEAARTIILGEPEPSDAGEAS